MHEAQMHKENCFITLTYDDKHVSTSLDYRDFQLFLKRLRKTHGPVRFFMSGEYGSEFNRPHFHACIFGLDFSADRVFLKETAAGGKIYRSPALEALWDKGFSSIGDVTFESAAYIARYVMKKVGGNIKDKHYETYDIYTGEITSRVPEFGRMSLRPGLGLGWVHRFSGDILGNGALVMDGNKMKVPKYYMKYLENIDRKACSEMEYNGIMYAESTQHEQTERRLSDREKVAKAKLNFKKRILE